MIATTTSDIIYVSIALIMMFVTDPVMAITAVLSSLIGFALMSVILVKSQKNPYFPPPLFAR